MVAVFMFLVDTAAAAAMTPHSLLSPLATVHVKSSCGLSAHLINERNYRILRSLDMWSPENVHEGSMGWLLCNLVIKPGPRNKC